MYQFKRIGEVKWHDANERTSFKLFKKNLIESFNLVKKDCKMFESF